MLTEPVLVVPVAVVEVQVLEAIPEICKMSLSHKLIFSNPYIFAT